MMKLFHGGETAYKKTAFGFFILFLLTLTNSIFLNQLGYYGALILLLIAFFKGEKDTFSRTGIELPVLIYIAALIISTALSVDTANSFHNLLKRILLIPIIYTGVAVLNDGRKIKIAVFIFLASAIAVVIVYLVHSYDYFIQNLYNIRESGPSLFQYPITASELMSIVLIFCFALIFDEELSVKWRAASAVGFLLSSAALLATYKRTGWLAAAAGLITVLLLRKQWKLVGAGLIIFVILIYTDRSYSEVLIYRGYENSVSATEVEITAGRANNIMHSGGKQFLSDYEGGLIVRSTDDKAAYETGTAVLESRPLTDSTALVYLVDTRFTIFNVLTNSFVRNVSFTSPGLVYAFSVSDEKVYIVDGDGYLTVFRLNGERIDSVHYPEINEYQKVFATDSGIILWSPGKGTGIYRNTSLHNLELFSSYPEMKKYEILGINNSSLFAYHPEKLNIYNFMNDSLKLTAQIEGIKSPVKMDTIDGDVYLWNSTGEVYKLVSDTTGKYNVAFNYSFNTAIKDIDVMNGDLYLTRYKRSRISSFYDPYNMSNQSRIAFWTAGLKIFKDHPLFGVGDIDLRDLYKQYKRPFDKEIQGHMHNNYVHILVTLGAFGFAAFIFLIIRLFVVLWRNIRHTHKAGFHNSIAIAALASFVAFLTAGLTEWNFGDHEIITMIWFVTALSIAATKAQSKVTAP